ncbi:oligopeptide ABC transporter substrate-binding protein OppA [Pasteurellaceae bacterium RH1A]|nr:oligopeptide ABC transporter substrate-binding protein OppA [Pasteurellaceae bacterium RH1A]
MQAQKQLKKLFTLSLLGSLVAFSHQAFAAKVPAGVELAAKQEIALQTTAEVSTLDPQKASGVPESRVLRQLSEGLVITDEADNIIPGVAERWESSPDFKEWTFHLRQDAKWSNGDPVTAQDFVFAWQRLVDPATASPYASYLNFMQLENAAKVVAGQAPKESLGVKALDDHTLQLTLEASVPYAVELTQHSSLMPVHRASVEKYGDNWTAADKFIGNGAYKISNRVINEKLELVRNDQYWNDKETVIDKATFVVLGESAGINRFRSGDLDVAMMPQPLYKDAKFQQEYGSQIHKFQKLGTFIYKFNMNKAPLDDVRVRKALDLGVDRDVIAHKVLGFGQKPTFTFTPDYIGAGEKIQQPEYAKWTQQERNEEAKKLLREAGFSKQNPLKAELLYNTNDGLKTIAIAVGSMWKTNLDGMVNISLKNQEWKTFLDMKKQGNYEIIFSAWSADYNEASTFLTYFLSNSEQNTSGFKSEKFDALIAQSYEAKTEDERAEIYAQAEAELDSHHPFVALYHYAGLFIKNPKLKGYEGKSAQDNYRIKDFYLEK